MTIQKEDFFTGQDGLGKPQSDPGKNEGDCHAPIAAVQMYEEQRNSVF